MSDDRVSNWVGMQCKTYDSDEGLKAEVICLENPSGDAIFTWPVSIENLAEVVRTALDMQAGELPKGAHRYRLVSYGSRDKSKQLSELPQTIRGRSSDASAAMSEAIAMQRATAMAVSNLENVNAITLRALEGVETRLSEMTENFTLTFDKLTVANSENFDQRMRFLEFEAKQKRNEVLLECLTPLITLAVEKYGGKLMNMDPETIRSLLDTKPAPAAPAEPPALQGQTNGEPDSVEPDHKPSAVVPKSGQRSVSRRSEARDQGNSQRHPRKRGAKASRKSTTNKGSKK
jgi:hypothetical protein